MNPEDKKEETKENPESHVSIKDGKLQRKLRFKTLDGNIKNLECDFDIKISELKKKLAEIYKIEPNRQRLLNKGKQFKDDEYLDKLVDKDNTIIHLVFRSEADVKQAQENAQNNTNTNQPQNQNNRSVDPFQNIFNIVSNSDQFRNLTNNLVSQIFSNQNNTNNNNNNSNQTQSNVHTINIGNTQFQALNVGEALNLANSPLHPIVQPPNLTSPPSLNLNNNNQNNNSNVNANTNHNNEGNVDLNNKNYSGQFPITPSVTDKKYDTHLKNIEKELNSADELMSQKIEPRIPLPLLNTTQNVFTAISRSLRRYVIVNQNILCHLMYLADIMEREQFISNSDTRMTGNKLLDKAYKSLLHIGKASNDLSNVIKSSNFNTAPNTGYIGVVCQEVGYHASPISINAGELDAQNILSALRGANNNSNNNTNNNTRNINITTNSGNQGQNGVTEINATIPLNIVEVTVEEGGNDNIDVNINNSTTNNQTQNIPSTNATTIVTENKNNKEKEEEEKKDNNSKQNDPKEKDPDKEKQTVNDSTQNNEKNNVPNNNNTQNNTQTQNTVSNNNNFNNLFGNMMNQLMTPENLNSIAGAVGSMLNNPNQSGGNNNNPMGGLFGNLLSNLMGSLGDESDEEEERNEQPTLKQPTTESQQKEQKKEETTTTKAKENSDEKGNTNNTHNDTTTNNCNSSNNNNSNSDKKYLIKKLVESPQLRRETKISDESKVGEKMEPNIEFVSVSKEVISNLTIQEVFDMYNLHFKGLSRMRKEIQKKYFSDKAKNDEIIKKMIELLCERFILYENQIDKLNPNKEFNIEEFFNKHLKQLLNMFIEENEINKNDSDWEDNFRKLVINMYISLINELKEVYETGEDGAKTFIEFNTLTLIENFIGQKYLSLIQSYDEDVINKFVENLFTIVKAEEIKKKCNSEEEKKNSNNNNISENNENIERHSLLSVEEIFKIASEDKERLDKEEKEKSEEEKKMKKFSDFYYLTSLFKS